MEVFNFGVGLGEAQLGLAYIGGDDLVVMVGDGNGSLAVACAGIPGEGVVGGPFSKE